MRIEVQRHLLAHIAEEWQMLLRRPSPPWGVWVRRYPPITNPTDNPFGQWPVPASAWFVSRRGMSPRSVWEYRRYVVVQREKPWCQRPFGEPTRAAGTFFEIGEAAFAPSPVENEFYVETLWGGLYGEGRLVALSPEGGVTRKRRLWVA